MKFTAGAALSLLCMGPVCAEALSGTCVFDKEIRTNRMSDEVYIYDSTLVLGIKDNIVEQEMRSPEGHWIGHICHRWEKIYGPELVDEEAYIGFLRPQQLIVGSRNELDTSKRDATLVLPQDSQTIILYGVCKLD